MKINIFVLVFIFLSFISFSVEKYENNYYRKFLSISNDKNEMLEDFLSEKEQKQNLIDEEEQKRMREMNKYEQEDSSDATDETRDEKKDRTYINVKCLFVSKYNVYSLQKLTKDNGYKFETAKGEVEFNFCQDINGQKSTVVLHNNETNETKIT